MVYDHCLIELFILVTHAYVEEFIVGRLRRSVCYELANSEIVPSLPNTRTFHRLRGGIVALFHSIGQGTKARFLLESQGGTRRGSEAQFGDWNWEVAKRRTVHVIQFHRLLRSDFSNSEWSDTTLRQGISLSSGGTTHEDDVADPESLGPPIKIGLAQLLESFVHPN